ncbi:MULTISPECIES: sensor histidine kinase [Actinosynnema]|uniref:sensor histidine kinase n=1 Tax=Actinosynnema TaxID=40566 RepID=UPI0020A310CB|nr:sensor histidine kinase [Actinosynnema pretiosum]MCP2097161.1 Signal transduction histidine kinase [Actinosynnema pretiosum]
MPAPSRRGNRDWLVDGAFFALAAGYALVYRTQLTDLPHWLLLADQLAAALGCALLWARKRHPVLVTAVLGVLGAVSLPVQGAATLALFSLAVHRPPRVVAAVGALALLTAPVYPLLRVDPELAPVESVVLSVVLYAGVTGWGASVRAHRQLVDSLRERAEQAERQARERAEREHERAQAAARAERERIAREVHDVLAHRLSLLSVYAGALEYRADADRAQVARAAAVIRETSHLALQDVREVIGVLRAPVESPDRPAPVLDAVGELVEQSRLAGARVVVEDSVAPGAPEAVGRAAYRVVQEGLTNARKHAPGQDVLVRLSGGPGADLVVEVHNPLGTALSVPGAGAGLTGLAERVALVGGELEHGVGARGHRLWARLPW